MSSPIQARLKDLESRLSKFSNKSSLLSMPVLAGAVIGLLAIGMAYWYKLDHFKDASGEMDMKHLGFAAILSIVLFAALGWAINHFLLEPKATNGSGKKALPFTPIPDPQSVSAQNFSF